MTQTEIDELIDAKLYGMLKDDPVKMTVFMLSQLGRQAVNANAGEMTISQESNIDEHRYKIKCKVTVKKIGKAIPKVNTKTP